MQNRNLLVKSTPKINRSELVATSYRSRDVLVTTALVAVGYTRRTGTVLAVTRLGLSVGSWFLGSIRGSDRLWVLHENCSNLLQVRTTMF